LRPSDRSVPNVNSLQAKHLLIDLAPNLIDSDPTGMTLLSTDLHVALESVNRHDAPRGSATVQTRQRHARHAYDEAIALLPRWSLDDERRSCLESQLTALRVRLRQLGEQL
jgi:hypothetical protein